MGHVLPLGTAMYLVSKFKGTKYSVVLHGMDLALALRNPWKRFLTRLILNRAEKIISPNSYTAKICANFLSSNKADFLEKIKVVNLKIQ